MFTRKQVKHREKFAKWLLANPGRQVRVAAIQGKKVCFVCAAEVALLGRGTGYNDKRASFDSERVGEMLGLKGRMGPDEWRRDCDDYTTLNDRLGGYDLEAGRVDGEEVPVAALPNFVDFAYLLRAEHGADPLTGKLPRGYAYAEIQ